MRQFKSFLLMGILLSGFGLISCTHSEDASGVDSKPVYGKSEHEHGYYND